MCTLKSFQSLVFVFFFSLQPGLTLSSIAVGQDTSEPSPAPTEQSISIESIERTISDLENRKDIDAEQRAQAIDNYRAALNNLRSATENEATARALAAETESVALRVEQLKQQRAELKDQKPNVEPGLSLAEMEQLLPQWELLLANHKKSRQAAELDQQTRSQRRKEIRTLMVGKEQRIADTTSQLKLLTSSETSTQSNSFAVRLITRRMTLVKELPALQAELAKYDAEESADILRLRIDVANANAAHREKCIELLQKEITTARERAAELSIQQARFEAIAAAPSLKDYAETNQKLAEKTKFIAEELAKAEQQQKLAAEAYEGLVRQFNLTRKKVETVGLTSSIGAHLRKQKQDLPDVSERRAAVSLRQPLINDIQYEIFDLEDQRQEVGDAKSLLAETVGEPQPKPDTQSAHSAALDLALLESAAQELIQRRSETLDTLIKSDGQYFDELIELDTKDQQLIKLVADYENYIDERVLWIRSGRPLMSDFSFDASDSWLISPAKWVEVGTALLADIQNRYYLYLLILLPWTVLLVRGRKIRDAIGRFGDTAYRANCRSILPTLKAVFLTALVSGVWPAFCALFAWRLHRVAGDSEFIAALSNGFLCVALLWIVLEFVRQICRPMGLGEAHFRWSTHATESLRGGLRTITMIALPLVFVTATLSVSERSHGRDSLERVFFLLVMVVAAYGMFRLLTPGGVLREYFSSDESPWGGRIKHLWSIFGTSVPLSLAALAIAGYYYTAEVLSWRLFATFGFVISLLIIRSLFFRMLMLRRRYLSMEQSRQRAMASVSTTESSSHLVAGIVTEDPKADITAQSQQSRRLINSAMIACSVVGLWMIWVQVLPALSMLDNYPVWKTAPTASVQSAAAVPSIAASMMPATDDGADMTGNSYGDIRDASVITLSDLALALLIVAVTFVLFRNGPGLLEMSVLQQLPVDASVRYAITTLVSYAIVLIGTIASCSTIGLQWSQIQWLATALTFGLAFGLQEMFANFVAGLIILLERPIRVGDIVTVDDVSGVVSRIRIRATSITNWDRKEYVVPNKEFITGRLLNWTLSDKINRIVVNVGVAYGSDTERAREILQSVAKEHPLTLDDPPPNATFEGFGDSALNMVLRVYLPTLDNRLEVIHQLHTAINRAFRAEGIEIAFPQRDLHIRTSVAGATALGLSSETTSVNESANGDLSREAA
ncbi:mechanosensitive ion channel domain-containing protein [Aporhodopirellula aestuarii]|uniref:Mechanosensitive ion channel n=1 Tax=Aporhodopirellula aestuarii TaxID=2950107 RepID=A0ABT0UBG0_9BACT|nr:mechanosensitive ion channel domain-containing protein [Aporhodopirellula aestuarii]MCM2374359.1 mechanosensitive ion channel [Aporhodopirellula aestuarii]